MSTDFGLINGRPNATHTQGPGLRGAIHVNRFAGGPDGPCVQLTIDSVYVQLDSDGARDLIIRLAQTEVIR